MKKLLRSLLVIALLLGMTGTASVYALSLGENITISDQNFNTKKLWYTDREDQEVEPGMQIDQGWDLEGFFFEGAMLSMVGGYDFVNGKGNMESGDIFIDVDGDAVYGDIHNKSTKGNKVVNDTFGYDYVLDLNFDDFTYTVYGLGENATTITSYYKQNQGSNPWLYNDGGVYITEGAFSYSSDLSDADVGFAGGYHNVVTDLDLSFLGAGNNFTAHYTMECGNDNLMGYGAIATPEPGTIALLGLGLLGIVGIARKKRT